MGVDFPFGVTCEHVSISGHGNINVGPTCYQFRSANQCNTSLLFGLWCGKTFSHHPLSTTAESRLLVCTFGILMRVAIFTPALAHIDKCSMILMSTGHLICVLLFCGGTCHCLPLRVSLGGDRARRGPVGTHDGGGMFFMGNAAPQCLCSLGKRGCLAMPAKPCV